MDEYLKQQAEQIERLEKDLLMLNALEEAGVDNWEGYGDAVDIMEGYGDESRRD